MLRALIDLTDWVQLVACALGLGGEHLFQRTCVCHRQVRRLRLGVLVRLMLSIVHLIFEARIERGKSTRTSRSHDSSVV